MGSHHTLCFVTGFFYLKVVSRFIHVQARGSTSFITKQCSLVWIHHIVFIYLPADGNVGCFPFLAIMSNAAMDIHMRVFVWMYVFISPGYAYLGVELLGHMVTIFSPLEKCQIVFQKGYIIWHIHQQYWGFRVSTSLPTLVVTCLSFLLLLSSS